MECWEHPGVEAAGVCARCGKAGCRHCLTMAAGLVICRSCATLLGAGAPPREPVPLAPVDPKKRMSAAWIGAGVFLIWGVATVLAVPPGPTAPRPPLWQFIPGLLIFAWIGWGLVWTAPPILGWLHRRVVARVAAAVRLAQPGCLLSAFFAWLTIAIFWYLLFFPAIIVAMSYGLLGGGLREAGRCRRAWSARPAPESVSPAQ
jgi:hypothetical protein